MKLKKRKKENQNKAEQRTGKAKRKKTTGKDKSGEEVKKKYK